MHHRSHDQGGLHRGGGLHPGRGSASGALHPGRGSASGGLHPGGGGWADPPGVCLQGGLSRPPSKLNLNMLCGYYIAKIWWTEGLIK